MFVNWISQLLPKNFHVLTIPRSSLKAARWATGKGPWVGGRDLFIPSSPDAEILEKKPRRKFRYYKIWIRIDTTVETILATSKVVARGIIRNTEVKKGLRPILGFIDETKEYLLGRLRRGITLSGKEAAAFMLKIKYQLPGCVQQVLLRADGTLPEFLSTEPARRQSSQCNFERCRWDLRAKFRF